MKKWIVSIIVLLGVTLFPSVVNAEEAWKLEMLNRINANRANAGLPSLALCERLSNAAEIHSLDQALRGDLGHVSSNGMTFVDRIRLAGYGGRGWGENVAVGYNNVPDVMAGWMASPSHRSNILNPLWDHVGVGNAVGDGRVYWTQNFGVGGICK